MNIKKFEFTPASLRLIENFSDKSMSEKKDLIDLLTKRAAIASKEQAGFVLTKEEKWTIKPGTFCPDTKEVLFMGVKLGVIPTHPVMPVCEMVN